jgi:hypothetical protein
MKKLIILGAVAAMSAAYGAEASYLAQVYDASLTLKTGVCRPGKVTSGTVKFYQAHGLTKAWLEARGIVKGSEMAFRKQATRKITGVIWGCDCETIAFPAWRAYRATAGWNLGGYAFWDQSADNYYVLPNTAFGWLCLNRITDNFKSVEGSWQLANNLNPQWMYMLGAGNGKASIASRPCRSIISSISGSFAGVRWPGMDDNATDCAYCGIGNCNVRPFCEVCRIWTRNRQLTAAYGSWSIKFNKTASNKLKNTAFITSSYTFKKAGNLPRVLRNMEVFVRNFGRLGGFPGIAQGDRAIMAPLVVRLAYLYGIAPAAVKIGLGPTVTIDPAAILLAEDVEQEEDEEKGTIKLTFDLDPDSIDEDGSYTDMYEDAESSKLVEDLYLSYLGYARMSDVLDLEDEDEDYDDDDDAWDDDDEDDWDDDDWDDDDYDDYIGDEDEWYLECKACFGDKGDKEDDVFLKFIVRLVDSLVGDAS